MCLETEVTRQYMYVFGNECTQVLYYTKEGMENHLQLFHTLEFNNGEATPVHLCGEDTYSGTISLMGEHNWKSTWDVRGPSKSFIIETTYTRDFLL
jgi:hypothetical protein